MGAMNTHSIQNKRGSENLSTWHNTENGCGKQPDYISIINRRRNWDMQMKTKKLQTLMADTGVNYYA